MAELNKGGVSAPNTSFTSVTPFAPAKSIVGDVLGAAIQGTALIAKSNASSAGVEAAASQSGSDLTLEQLNSNVDDLNNSIARGLATEKDKVEGPISSRRVAEVKDASLSKAKTTDRELQSLVDLGVITTTEANARRNLELSRLKNQGANFLFPDVFEDAFFRATGGRAGTAASSVFTKTAEELQQEQIAKERNKAIAEFEGKVAGAVQSSGKPESEIRAEFAFNDQLKRQQSILQQKQLVQTLASDEVAQLFDISQASSSQGLDLVRSNLSVDGVLDAQANTAYLSNIENMARQMQVELGNIDNLSASDRDVRSKDIDAWRQAEIDRASIYNKDSRDKKGLEAIERGVKFAGIAAMPYLKVITSVNPEVGAALSKLDQGNFTKQARFFLGEEGFTNLGKTAAGFKSMANFYLGGGRPVKDYNWPALSIGTEAGQDVMEKAFEGSDKPIDYVRMVTNASALTLGQLNTGSWVKRGNENQVGTQKAIKGTFDIYRKNLAFQLESLGASPVTITVGSRPNQFTASIPDVLIENGDPQGQKEAVKEAFAIFRKQPWIWTDDFDNVETAFNSYMAGKFDISTVDERRIQSQQTEGSKTPSKKVNTDEPLSVANNNPANLRSFGDVPTVDTPSGKFVKFPNKADGIRAAARNFQTKLFRGDNTVEEIINQQSPDSDPENIKRGFTNEGFKEAVAKAIGKGRNEVIDEKDLPKLLKAIFDFESGNRSGVTNEEILKGIEDAKIDR